MNRFSVTFLSERARLYTINKDIYYHFLSKMDLVLKNTILCQTVLGDEYTYYIYDRPNDISNSLNHDFFKKMCVNEDPRSYIIINIHEDCPGIDHVGIIHHISGYFLKKQIPILYINTYGHNLVLVSEEYLSQVQDIFSEIAYT
jgi:ACT domain